MDALLTVEPFGFFSREALRAGWYVFWRQLVRILPAAILVGAVGGAFIGLRMIVLGTVIMALGFIAITIWGAVLIPKFASRWAEARYGYGLSGPFSVWWGITWRVVVASIVASVILTPPQLVATSLMASYRGSALAGLGQLLILLMGLLGFVVSTLATGWAMSKIAADQLSGLPVTAADPDLAAREPVAVVAPLPMATVPVAMPGSMSAPSLAAPAPSSVSTATEGKRQCPKCSLYETERGTVIGWYCTVCGWREGRR